MERSLRVAWAAGFFDGEGSVQLKKARSKRTAFVPLLHAVQTRLAPLEELRDLFGGHVHTRTQRPGWQPIFEWTRGDKQAVGATLREMRPFLQVKGPQADLALEYIAGMRVVRGHPRLSDEEVSSRVALAERLHTLNARGAEK